MSVATCCPQCGASLSADAPAGLCPECLLRQGLDSAVVSISKTPTVVGSGFVPPSPAEMAACFPQLEILDLLGKGGMGAVYKARQPALDRIVALKVLPPEVGQDPAFAERFAREARALARLSHQNIVAVYEFGQSAGRTSKSAHPQDKSNMGGLGSPPYYYFLMEYVDGANLRQMIHGGHLAPAEALAIVPQICAALQFAHEEGIVHRDVKPENILVDKRGRVKIADFGLAKLLRVAPVDVTLTQANQVMGTWHYMAPEQVEHPQTVDHRADIYSLGVVFYEMLTGKLPLGRFEPPSQSSSVDARIDQVVLRALEREPERRYQYASEVKTDVEAIQSAVNGRTSVTASPTASRSATDELAERGLVLLSAVVAFVWVWFCGKLLVGSAILVWEAAASWEHGEGTTNNVWLPSLGVIGGLVGVGVGIRGLAFLWTMLRALETDDPSSDEAQGPATRRNPATSEAAVQGGRPPTLTEAPLGALLSELFSGWLLYVFVVFCIAVTATGVGTAWQFGTLGRWGGPAVEVDPQFAWLRWPLVGFGLLMAVLGGLGLVRLSSAWRAQPAASARPLTKEEREYRFWDKTGAFAILLLLALAAFGTWVTQSPWMLLALALPWAVPGIAAATDKREEPSWYVLWVMVVLVLATFGLIGYGIWLTKSGWPLLALAVPIASLIFMYHVFADEDDAAKPEETGSAEAEKQDDAETGAEESDDSGWGCLIIPVLVFVVAPLFQFVTSAVSDVNEFLLEEFGLDPRLKRPLLGAIWIVLVGALAYAGYQIYELLHPEESSEGTGDGSDPQTAADQQGERRRWWVKLGGSISPVVVVIALVLLAPSFRGEKTPPITPADAPTRTQASQLVQAASEGDVAKVRELLSAGADVNSVDAKTGDTPLIRAAARGHTALAVTLILLGADVNAQNKQGHSALMLAAENGRTATIRALFDLRQLTREDDVEQRKAALRAFPGFDRALIAGRDLDLADLKVEEMLRDEKGETASIKALRADDPACFALFTNDMDNQLARDQRGRNVVMHAAIEGRADLFRRLQQEPYFGIAGVDNVYVGAMVMFDFELSLSYLDNDGKSALQLAEEHNQKEIADILRAHFEAIVANQTREIEKGGEDAAKHRRLRGLAQRALGRAEQAQPDLVSPAAGPGQELLVAAAAGDLAGIRRLLAAGADVNSADPGTGETPLMRAAANGQSAAAVVLLMRRANEQARDKQRMTPVMHAVLGGHADLVQLLAEMSSVSWDEEVQFRVSRLDAELPRDTDFKSMRFDAALEAQDENGETALMKAAARGDVECVTALLRWEGNESARDRQGRTALMHAIANGQTALLKSMIDGAEASIRHTPPGHTVSGFVSPEVLSVTDNEGRTPLAMAREQGLEPIAAALQTYLEHVIDKQTRGIEAQGPYLWYIYHVRGHAYLALGEAEEAKADLEQARELNQQKP